MIYDGEDTDVYVEDLESGAQRWEVARPVGEEAVPQNLPSPPAGAKKKTKTSKTPKSGAKAKAKAAAAAAAAEVAAAAAAAAAATAKEKATAAAEAAAAAAAAAEAEAAAGKKSSYLDMVLEVRVIMYHNNNVGAVGKGLGEGGGVWRGLKEDCCLALEDGRKMKKRGRQRNREWMFGNLLLVVDDGGGGGVAAGAAAAAAAAAAGGAATAAAAGAAEKVNK